MAVTTISVLNMKGGVGKSTTSLNLAYEFATEPWHKRVLLVDLDPQFNSSQYLLGVATYEKAVLQEERPTTWDIFEQNTRMPGVQMRVFEASAAAMNVKRFVAGGSIDLIPSRLDLALSLRNPAQKEGLLAKTLSELESEYDLVLIDCPPTESVLTAAAYLASDYLLVPVKPEYLSAIGLPLLRQSLDDFRRDHPQSALQVAGIVFNGSTDYAPEEDTSKREVKTLASRLGWRVFEAEIPFSRSFPKGAREAQPIFWTTYARHAVIARVQDFARELAAVIGL